MKTTSSLRYYSNTILCAVQIEWMCHHIHMVPRKPLIPQQNRRAKSFQDSVVHQAPRSNNSPTTFSYARRGKGVQGESVNSGTNPMYIISRRRNNGVTY